MVRSDRRAAGLLNTAEARRALFNPPNLPVELLDRVTNLGNVDDVEAD